ncbi:hypothetical protein HanRHA438_Chr05g0222061 [Helianthus annuus]|uniref:Uncharacterized protein n=1 Tax=Helianthus annuus TaxID=4232 RepID=A0A9K3IYZ3_HELAN|nr:hypothetical protein HanXRQr2_Chr05g0212641 [Helianthus annuus]KAJ0570093.1 hypothetical protein HanHA300_Chr05g0174161 [Helianthus annuus]KAJ0576828.1 hypothetical protein HanIR_Chr05g0228921 [Helianthus annuus]KAJ0584425.1 hypothetical protein HanHA89_Chr05g0188471 [Helianthus annuus]KAJ0747050.1 hypothetical protein HanOQP8_Chr05g0185011 [Helianthus annuus]
MTVLPYGLNFGVSYGLRPTYYINDNVMFWSWYDLVFFWSWSVIAGMIWCCFGLVLVWSCFGLVLF